MNDQQTTTTTTPVLAEPVPNIDPLAEAKAKLTETEKEEFFKAFLADKPYIGSEALFKGKIPIKFSSLTIKQNNAILLQMQFDREIGEAKSNDKYLIRVIQYRIAASLLEFNGNPFAPDITEYSTPSNHTEHTTYLLKRLELMEQWGVYKISSLTEAFNRFERKLRALTEESFAESF